MLAYSNTPMQPEQIFYFVILIFSVILHEVAHGHAANMLGDPTARLAGRLTLNPIKHADPIGSVLLPLLCALSPGSFIFGWAKPVPYNPYNLHRAPRWGEAIVAGAGPATNLAIALFFAAIARLVPGSELTPVCFIAVIVNIWLALLNLIPIPPLDGSKILSALLEGTMLGGSYERFRSSLEFQPFLGFGIVLMLVIVFGSAFGSFVFTISRLLVGF